MARTIKSVSIPDRLRDKADAIDNFSAFVVAALDGVDLENYERYQQIRASYWADLEDVLEELRNFEVNLRHVLEAQPHHRRSAIQALRGLNQKNLEAWRAHCDDVQGRY